MITQGRLLYGNLHQFPGHKAWVYHTMLNIMALFKMVAQMLLTIKYFCKVSILMLALGI